VTRFFTEAGVGQVIDFMPPAGSTATENHRLVRMVHCVRGRMSFDVELAPRFDYSRQSHQVAMTENGATFTARELAVTLHVVREPEDERIAHVTVEDQDVHATVDLVAGQVRGVLLESSADGPPREISVAGIRRLFDETMGFWRSWLAGSTYTGRWRQAVQRSAITLKLRPTPRRAAWSPRRPLPCPARADRQFPPGFHAPGPDRCGGHPRRRAGPAAVRLRMTRRNRPA
jgi:GH15 family glucan-1,4-alpha-glucosidase